MDLTSVRSACRIKEQASQLPSAGSFFLLLSHSDRFLGCVGIGEHHGFQSEIKTPLPLWKYSRR